MLRTIKGVFRTRAGLFRTRAGFFMTLKAMFAKNERGYRLNAIKKAVLIATNLTSICCCKEKIV